MKFTKNIKDDKLAKFILKFYFSGRVFLVVWIGLFALFPLLDLDPNEIHGTPLEYILVFHLVLIIIKWLFLTKVKYQILWFRKLHKSNCKY